jgi:hypothetical protein
MKRVPSASTSAPASSAHSPPVSLTAVTVRPAEVVPIPVVKTLRELILAAYLDGSSSTQVSAQPQNLVLPALAQPPGHHSPQKLRLAGAGITDNHEMRFAAHFQAVLPTRGLRHTTNQSAHHSQLHCKQTEQLRAHLRDLRAKCASERKEERFVKAGRAEPACFGQTKACGHASAKIDQSRSSCPLSRSKTIST